MIRGKIQERRAQHLNKDLAVKGRYGNLCGFVAAVSAQSLRRAGILYVHPGVDLVWFFTRRNLIIQAHILEEIPQV